VISDGGTEVAFESQSRLVDQDIDAHIDVYVAALG
jgi:hypothetical protein